MNLQFEKEVGLRIRKIRERQNLTQAEVPARLQVCSRDVTRSALAKIEARALKEVLRLTYEEIPEQGVKKE